MDTFHWNQGCPLFTDPLTLTFDLDMTLLKVAFCAHLSLFQVSLKTTQSLFFLQFFIDMKENKHGENDLDL